MRRIIFFLFCTIHAADDISFVPEQPLEELPVQVPVELPVQVPAQVPGRIDAIIADVPFEDNDQTESGIYK